MNLSIVIPAFNEERRLPPSLNKIYSWFGRKNISGEIIVVDDGSRDRTAEKVKRLQKKFTTLRLISYKQNYGKGYALKRGMLNARGQVVIFTDADLSTPISEAEKIIRGIKDGADVVYGSRFSEQSRVLAKASFGRNLMARLFNLGIRLLILSGPIDTQCGFKGFRKQAAKKIFRDIKLNSVLFDLEVFLLANKFKFKIREVGVTWKHDPDSRLKYNLKKSILILWELIRLKFLYKVWLPVKIQETRRYEWELHYQSDRNYWWAQGRKELVLSLAKKYLMGLRGKRVLDVGLGSGILALAMQKSGAQVLGIDASPAAVEHCKTLGLNALVAKAEKLPYRNSFFDGVFLVDILEHIKKQMPALSEAKRVLKDGGAIFIIAPALPALWSSRDERLGHFRRYTRQTLVETISAAGLKVLRSSYFVLFLLPLWLLRVKFNREIKTDLMLSPRFFDRLFLKTLRLENALLRYIDLPIGVSVFAIAKK